MSVKKIRQKQTHMSSSKTKGNPQKKQSQINRTPSNTESKKSPKNKKALVIAHEIKFAKLLAGNDKRVRDKVLKNLRKWLTIRSESSFAFVEPDFMRLWKGLYYCMWMSDKPLIQEELAESLSKLVHCFNNVDAALLYTKCTLHTLASEWFGIDQHRLDKFQMLVRRIIRQTFVMCKKNSWDRQWVDGVVKIVENILSDTKTTIGFSLHITELYMEELSKVSGGDIPEDIVVEFVRPFAIHLAEMSDERQIRHVMKHVFRYLLFQSDVGLDYVEKFEAWRHAGFPKGNIDAMQKVEIDQEDEDEAEDEEDDESNEDQANDTDDKPLDPRAGRVDVELPQLPFDPKAVADLVLTYRFHPSSNTKTRRQILRIAKEFTELSQGNMPLGIKQIKLREGSKAETNPKGAALRLLKFEQELYSDTIHGKRKKKTAQITDEVLDEDRDEDADADDDFVPKKKKINLENTKKRPREENTETGKREGAGEEKSKAIINQSKKKSGSLKAEKEADEADPVADTPKKKKKNSKKANLEPVQGLKQKNKTVQQKQIDADVSLSESQIYTPGKKSAIDNGAKRIRRDSSEGSWSVSEIVTPISPSRLDENVATPSPQDNSEPAVKPQTPTAQSLATPVKTKEIVKQMKLQTSKLTPVTPQLQKIPPATTTSSKKKVKIVLQRNTAQLTSEYMRQLRRSPAIPYDANRKPLVGVLKPSPIPSPVNPFYNRRSK